MMRKIVFAVLLIPFVLGSCLSGKGKMVMKFEVYSGQMTPEIAKQTEAVFQKRLSGIGISDKDISIRENGKIISVEISEISNYSDLKDRIPFLLSRDGHLALWETYSKSEILMKLQSGLLNMHNSEGGDSIGTKWSKFVGLIDLNSFHQPVIQSYQTDPDCLIAYAQASDTSAMRSLMDSLKMVAILPRNFRLGWTATPGTQMNSKNGKHDLFGMIALKSGADGNARFDRPVLTYAKSHMNSISGSNFPEVYFGMEGADADAWHRMTSANIQKCVAIVIDGQVYSWPTVLAPISGGVCSITGSFSDNDVKELVTILNAQSLPSPLNLVETNILP